MQSIGKYFLNYYRQQIQEAAAYQTQNPHGAGTSLDLTTAKSAPPKLTDKLPQRNERFQLKQTTEQQPKLKTKLTEQQLQLHLYRQQLPYLIRYQYTNEDLKNFQATRMTNPTENNE